MDKSNHTRYRQLANDAVIATFGESGLTAQLAEALEKCVSELNDANAECPTCSARENYGDFEDESIRIDASDVVSIHGELKKLLKLFLEFHNKLELEVHKEIEEQEIALLLDELYEIINGTEDQIDELEALTFV